MLEKEIVNNNNNNRDVGNVKENKMMRESVQSMNELMKVYEKMNEYL